MPKFWPHAYLQASRAYNLQAQHVSTLTSELNHVTAELGSVRASLEANATAHANNAEQVCRCENHLELASGTALQEHAPIL